MKERVLQEALYMEKTKETIRSIASHFNVSKSTVHKDLKERLTEIDLDLASRISSILNHHKEERHIRGGESTKKKYMEMKIKK